MEFKRLTIEDRKAYAEFADSYAPRNTYYSFATRYMWGDTYVAHYPDGMGFYTVYEGRGSYMYPVGRCDIKKIIEDYMVDSKTRNIPFSMDGLSRDDCNVVEEAFPGRFNFTTNRDYSDYIYNIDDLADLKGRKYHKKKNHVNKFKSEHPNYKIVPIDKENIEIARALSDEWFRTREIRCENKECVEKSDDYCSEKIAITKAYENYDELGMEGAILFAEEKALAMTMASRLSSDTFDIHFEKSIDEGVAYSVINYEFARMIRENHPEVKYLNREEDLGLEGLRQAKTSYHPHHLEDKYRCTCKTIEENN